MQFSEVKRSLGLSYRVSAPCLDLRDSFNLTDDNDAVCLDQPISEDVASSETVPELTMIYLVQSWRSHMLYMH